MSRVDLGMKLIDTRLIRHWRSGGRILYASVEKLGTHMVRRGGLLKHRRPTCSAMLISLLLPSHKFFLLLFSGVVLWIYTCVDRSASIMRPTRMSSDGASSPQDGMGADMKDC